MKRQQKYELLGNPSVHTKSVQGSSSVQPASVDSAQPHPSQQSLLPVHVLGLPLHQLSCAKLFPTVSATGAFTPLHFALCSSGSVFPSLMALHQLFHTSIYPRQWPHTLPSLFLLLVSCLRLCWFSRNKVEGVISISFFPSSGIWSAVLSVSSPLQNTEAVG